MNSFKSDYGNNCEVLRQTLSECENPNFGVTQSQELRRIEEIPHPYQQIFNGFLSFNLIQSRIFDDVFYTDDSMVIAAPTGSGKTVIFEQAIIRLLINLERDEKTDEPFKIVYISPVKALCEERLVDWHKKFTNFGINSISVTGDSENVEFKDLLNHNLIITTPEKWDCLTRKWRENVKLVQIVKLFMIDEVHILNEDCRGSTLETIVCRMKTIQEDSGDAKIRFIAVSATIPNVEDVAEWLGPTTKSFTFSDDFRPVKLKKIVIGYSETNKTSPFTFDLSLNYKLHSLIAQHSNGKPTLIFCATRKIVEMTAKHIIQNSTIQLKPEQREHLKFASNSINDGKLQECVVHGVGYHHAGMLPQIRKIIEDLFRNCKLPILVATSTLAIGVNLPAHLVIIKSTKCYGNGGFHDYTETALMQMIGRAGRPQFDTFATALILTTMKDKAKFEKMVGGLDAIESNLHRHLTEHLNAEVALETICDLGVAMRWLSSTFLYIRAQKNPKYYGLPSSDPTSIDRRLLEMCQIELNKLIKAGMLTVDSDAILKATKVGTAMAKYYLAFETMKLFTEINGDEALHQILALISKCNEFSEMYLRVNDKKCLNLLNKCTNRETIRFPLNGKIKTNDMKINCIIQAILGCLDICDHSLLSETLKIMRQGGRIIKCLMEYLESKDNCFRALLSTIILAKCLHVKLWETSPYVSKQLSGIGNVMSTQLVNAGKISFDIISHTDPREIELILNKKPPIGSKILRQIHHLPKYEMKLEIYGKNKLKLTLLLKNAPDLEHEITTNRNSLMHLLIGDSRNEILLYEKYSHSFMIENPNVVRYIDFDEPKIDSIEAHFISEDWVGIDCFTKYETVMEVAAKKRKVTKNQTKNLDYKQTLMDMYVKEKGSEKIHKEMNNSKIIIHGDITIVDNKTDKENKLPKFKKFERSKAKLSRSPKKLKEASSKTITWRSPLTYSPPAKFSPKTSDVPLIFPLSDKDHVNSSLDERSILEKVGDVVSTSLLESFRLISPKARSGIMTCNDYYQRLVSERPTKCDSSFSSDRSKTKSDDSSDRNKVLQDDRKKVASQYFDDGRKNKSDVDSGYQSIDNNKSLSFHHKSSSKQKLKSDFDTSYQSFCKAIDKGVSKVHLPSSTPNEASKFNNFGKLYVPNRGNESETISKRPINHCQADNERFVALSQSKKYDYHNSLQLENDRQYNYNDFVGQIVREKHAPSIDTHPSDNFYEKSFSRQNFHKYSTLNQSQCNRNDNNLLINGLKTPSRKPETITRIDDRYSISNQDFDNGYLSQNLENEAQFNERQSLSNHTLNNFDNGYLRQNRISQVADHGAPQFNDLFNDSQSVFKHHFNDFVNQSRASQAQMIQRRQPENLSIDNYHNSSFKDSSTRLPFSEYVKLNEPNISRFDNASSLSQYCFKNDFTRPRMEDNYGRNEHDMRSVVSMSRYQYNTPQISKPHLEEQKNDPFYTRSNSVMGNNFARSRTVAAESATKLLRHRTSSSDRQLSFQNSDLFDTTRLEKQKNDTFYTRTNSVVENNFSRSRSETEAATQLLRHRTTSSDRLAQLPFQNSDPFDNTRLEKQKNDTFYTRPRIEASESATKLLRHRTSSSDHQRQLSFQNSDPFDDSLDAEMINLTTPSKSFTKKDSFIDDDVSIIELTQENEDFPYLNYQSHINDYQYQKEFMTPTYSNHPIQGSLIPSQFLPAPFYQTRPQPRQLNPRDKYYMMQRYLSEF